MLNVSTLIGTRTAASDALRYGRHRTGEVTPRSSAVRRPVVVWNATRACNLACEHCYASAKRRRSAGELTTAEGRALLDDLAQYGIPAVLLSGGEPLSRADLPELVAHGAERGLRFTLSSNGTLIDTAMARRLAEVGVVYVGVSIDGNEATHDRFRREPGAWRRSLDGLQRLGEAGVRRGVRFTLSPASAPHLDEVLSLLVSQGVERFCMYHLVPSGRGAHLHDVSAAQRRDALHRLFAFAAGHPGIEVLTVDNPSDGAQLLEWLRPRDARRAGEAEEMLRWNRGARSGPGVGLACVDELGNVHPDQFSRHRTVGNVREQPFSRIWSEGRDPFLAQLRAGTARPMPAACTACRYAGVCGGGLRSRAELATGDPWGFDPACSVVAA